MVLRNGKYFQAEIVLLLQTLSRFYCLSSKPLREGRNTLWHYFNQCCLKRKSLVSDFIFLWCKFVMLSHACRTTFSLWHWEGLVVSGHFYCFFPTTLALQITLVASWGWDPFPGTGASPSWTLPALSDFIPPQHWSLEHKHLQGGTALLPPHFSSAPVFLIFNRDPKSPLGEPRDAQQCHSTESHSRVILDRKSVV